MGELCSPAGDLRSPSGRDAICPSLGGGRLSAAKPGGEKGLSFKVGNYAQISKPVIIKAPSERELSAKQTEGVVFSQFLQKKQPFERKSELKTTSDALCAPLSRSLPLPALAKNMPLAY